MSNEQNQVLRGFLANITMIPPLVVTFQYNPESVSDNKSVNYADRAATLSGNAPGKVYTGGGNRTITFDLKVHGLEQGTNAINPSPVDNGISTELAKLRSFLYPKADAWGMVSNLLGGSTPGKRLAAPPTCYFGFGTKILECTVTDIRITETQFNSALAPVRADVTVTLDVIEDDDNALYQLDKQHRNLLAALGLQNIRVF
jgi:Contractile injection system tube protein